MQPCELQPQDNLQSSRFSSLNNFSTSIPTQQSVVNGKQKIRILKKKNKNIKKRKEKILHAKYISLKEKQPMMKAFSDSEQIENYQRFNEEIVKEKVSQNLNQLIICCQKQNSLNNECQSKKKQKSCIKECQYQKPITRHAYAQHEKVVTELKFTQTNNPVLQSFNIKSPKQSINDNRNQTRIGIVLYQKQFNFLLELFRKLIKDLVSLKQSKNRKNLNLNQPQGGLSVVVLGDVQSGKKHLVDQVLKRLYCQWNQVQLNKEAKNEKQQINLIIHKHFVSRDTLYLNSHLLEDDSQVSDEFFNEQSQNYKKIKANSFKALQKEEVLMRVNIISNLTPEQYPKTKINENSKSQMNSQFKLEVNFYCLTQQQYGTLYQHQNHSEDINNSNNTQPNHHILHLPKLSSTESSPQISQSLKRLLISQIEQIQNKLNIQLEFYKQHYFILQCKQSVVAFTIKYILKKYQQFGLSGCHPVLALKYLNNYLENHFRARLKTIISLSQTYPSIQPTIRLSLSSTLVTQFYASVLPSQQCQQPSTATLHLTTFILGHQLILISCYLYLNSQQYMDSLYINALKLFRFFVIVQKTLAIDQFAENKYWELLERLKDCGLLKFCQDVKDQKCLKNNKYQKQTKKIKFIKEYKNHHFFLTFPLQKIKEDLQELQVYKKFFENST